MIIKNNKKIDFKYENLYRLVNYKIGIPMFQRFYAWKEKQVSQLLEDIEKLFDTDGELYLLDFIYYIEDDKIMLADGQQRIVTMNLLIKAINDTIDDKNLKINHLDYFDISYDIISNNSKYLQMMHEYPTAPFKKVYLNLLEFVHENCDENLIKLINVIKNKIFIYLKKCHNADDAFQIFQQINTGGKPLTKDEIIKTALDQYSVLYDIALDTSKIKEVRQAIISFYKYEEDDYNTNFDNMQIMSFMRKYITNSSDSFMRFKNYIEKLKINDSSPIYNVIDYINRPLLKDVLNILSVKNINITRRKEYQNDLMIPLCLASITLSLNGGSPPQFKYLVNDVIRKIKNDIPLDEVNHYIANYINERDGSFKMSLAKFTEKINSDLCSKNMKKAILILDVTYRNASGSLIVDNINLEHIYPQTPNKEWYQNGWPTSSDDIKRISNNIGNQILLCEAVNKRIQNEYITYKVDEYRRIMAKDRILQTEMNSFDFNKFEQLQETYIKTRQAKICKIIKDEWPFGSVLITNN